MGQAAAVLRRRRVASPLVSVVNRMSGPQGPPAQPDASRRQRRRRFRHVLLACLGLHLAWALAMPVTSAPDEPAHVYRAVSLWDGDLIPSVRAADGAWVVRVPQSVAEYAESTACTRHRPEVPAGCAPALTGPGGATTVETGAGRYIPPYYYAVGWPGRLDTGLAGFYGMRLASLVGSSVLLALAISTVLRTIGARWARLVLPIAMTPQVLWLGSMVNPNAWELDAGLLAWSAGLALASRLSIERREALWAKFLAGAVVLVLMRRLSPLWLLLIVVGILATRLCLPAMTRQQLPRLASGSAPVVLGVLVGLATFSVWWHLTFDLASVRGISSPQPSSENLVESLVALVPDVLSWIHQTYGVFGWLDTRSPQPAILAWLATGAVTFALVILGSRHRVRVAVTTGAGIALSLTIPLAFALTAGRQIGIHFWQARYTMPFASGIPLAMGVLGAAWHGRPRELLDVVRVVSPLVCLAWPVLATITFVSALHRYTNGQGAGWSLADLPWSPPGGVLALTALFALSSLFLVRALHDEAPSGPAPRTASAGIDGSSYGETIRSAGAR